jgi:hypothetical protein
MRISATAGQERCCSKYTITETERGSTLGWRLTVREVAAVMYNVRDSGSGWRLTVRVAHPDTRCLSNDLMRLAAAPLVPSSSDLAEYREPSAVYVRKSLLLAVCDGAVPPMP